MYEAERDKSSACPPCGSLRALECRLRQRRIHVNRLALPHGRFAIVGQNSLRAAGHRVLVFLRQPLREFVFDWSKFWIVRDVSPFVRISLLVVKFLAAVGVSDVAPLLRA